MLLALENVLRRNPMVGSANRLAKCGHGSYIGNYTGRLENARMHIITRKRLLDFAVRYPDARESLLDWERTLRRKRYRKTAEVKADFPSVDFIGQGCAVFNICGNAYRVVVKMDFRGSGLVLIRHVVTHKEYDRLIERGVL